MNIKKSMYVIDENYHILYRNKVFKEIYPHIGCGEICYKALGKLDEVCGHCPLIKNNKRNTFYNVATGEWINAQESEIEWEGKENCHALFCKIWKDDGSNEDIEDIEEESELLTELMSANEQMVSDMRQIKNHLEKKNLQKTDVITALSREYGNVYCVDLDDDSFEIYRLDGYVADNVSDAINKPESSFKYCIDTYIDSCVHEDDRDELRRALSAENIRLELEENESFVCNYRTCRGSYVLYYQVKCVRVDSKENQNKI